MNKSSIITWSIIGGIILLTIIIVCVVCIPKKTEPFYNTANGAFVDENTKAIRGNNIFSNHMMKAATPEEMLDNVRNDAYYAETGDLGAIANTTGVDKLMANQVEINNINRKNGSNIMSESDMRAISKKIMSSAGNQIGSPYNRAGEVLTELDVAPNRVMGIVNENFIGGRQKNYRVSVVKSVVPVKGFDISIDRLPEQMSSFSSTSFAANKYSKNNNKRLPSEASMKNTELVNYDNKDAEGFKTVSGGYLVKNNTRY